MLWCYRGGVDRCILSVAASEHCSPLQVLKCLLNLMISSASSPHAACSMQPICDVQPIWAQTQTQFVTEAFTAEKIENGGEPSRGPSALTHKHPQSFKQRNSALALICPSSCWYARDAPSQNQIQNQEFLLKSPPNATIKNPFYST